MWLRWSWHPYFDRFDAPEWPRSGRVPVHRLSSRAPHLPAGSCVSVYSKPAVRIHPPGQPFNTARLFRCPPGFCAGNRFSYSKQAVSIRLGGVCGKLKAWRQARKPWLLAVEDPQEMGKDVGSGSFAVRGELAGLAVRDERLGP